MRTEKADDSERERASIIDHARNAVEAIGRGELEVAEAEVERMRELVEEARTMAVQQRERLLRRLEEAKRAVSEGGERAREQLEAIVRELSSDGGEEAGPDGPGER
jgi:F0F1-type ATP synthase membrane subunit b/b'